MLSILRKVHCGVGWTSVLVLSKLRCWQWPGCGSTKPPLASWQNICTKADLSAPLRLACTYLLSFSICRAGIPSACSRGSGQPCQKHPPYIHTSCCFYWQLRWRTQRATKSQLLLSYLCHPSLPWLSNGILGSFADWLLLLLLPLCQFCGYES